MKRNYDVVVIGGGIGGLVAAALIVKAGRKVALIEKNATVGGYFSSFQTPDGDTIDYGASYLLSCLEGGDFCRTMKTLGLSAKIPYKKLNRTDTLYIKDRKFTFPSSFDDFSDDLKQEFPNAHTEIDAYFGWMEKFLYSGEAKSADSGKFFMRHYKESYKAFLYELVQDELLRAILSIRIQADPASLMLMAGFITECYGKGMAYPLGGSGNICSVLSAYIMEHGGEIFTEKRVVRYTAVDGIVQSAITQDNDVFAGSYFIHDADPFLLNQMLEDAVSIASIAERKVGHASLSVFLATEGLDLSGYDCGRIYLSEHNDIFRYYAELENGSIPEKPIVKVHIPSVHDDSLTKGTDRQIVRLETDIYYCNAHQSEEDYRDCAERMIALTQQKLLPELASHIVYKRVVTPQQFEELFLSKDASGTGWLHNVENYMLRTFNSKTNYNNLYIVGQWGENGSGIRQITISAEKAVARIEKALAKDSCGEKEKGK